jgi:1-acyl-sn-glycerol-3-phosphate acyltransferase
MALLYDAVAAGMWAYTQAAFRAQTLGAERLRVRPGTILAITHRRETDVPIVCPPLFYGSPMRRREELRMSFAARQDLFEPGFFAGFPQSVPAPARRALWQLDISRYLRVVKLLPVRSSALIRLVDVARLDPGLGLEAFPQALTAELLQRAADTGLSAPRLAGDIDRGEYGDLLWRTFTRAELGDPAFEDAWRRHGAAAAGDFRGLVEEVSRGGVLVLFPEGRPSPDGEIGPIQRGTRALVRRGKPSWIQPIGIAYDSLGPGRTRVYVSFGDPFPPPEDDVEPSVLSELRRAVPLTAGQVVAAALAEGRGPTGAELEAAVEAAREEGRNIAPELVSPESRGRRLAEAVRAGREARPEELRFLATEYGSARER